MKLAHLCVALAFAGVAVLGVPAAAQHAVDPSVVHPGAVELTVPMPALGSEYASPTQYTPDGTGEFAWGNHLVALLTVFADVLVPALVVVGLWLYARVTGRNVEADDAERLREYMQSGYHFGLNAMAPATRDKKLTVKDASPVVEWMLHYADILFPQLVEQFGGRDANRLRAWAIVDLAEGEAIPLANPAAKPIPAPAVKTTPMPHPVSP